MAALPINEFSKIVCHSEKSRLEVMIVDALSYLSDNFIQIALLYFGYIV